MFGLQILNEMENLHREMDQIFRGVSGYGAVRQNVGFRVRDDNDHYTVMATLPGLDADKLDIQVLGRELTVSGAFAEPEIPEDARWHRQERRSGEFKQKIELPTNLDTEKIGAEYVNGILTITLPKAASVLPKKIEVKVN